MPMRLGATVQTLSWAIRLNFLSISFLHAGVRAQPASVFRKRSDVVIQSDVRFGSKADIEVS